MSKPRLKLKEQFASISLTPAPPGLLLSRYRLSAELSAPALFFLSTMEVDEHAIDNGVTLVLDLAETDPFYEKKKKLLKDMGFDLESSVCIKSSSTPDQLKDVLDVLLRRARIINFNEVELYFGGDIINLGNCISPRNELEALHSILEVISKSLSGEKYTIKSIQKRLRDEIVERIDKVGRRFSEVAKIVGDSSCEKEKCLLDWGIYNGVKAKLDIAYVEGAGRGAIANEDLNVGDIALEIPVSVIICENVLHESDMFPIFEKVDGISEETMLLLWSMKEKHNNKSKFKLYFDTLPEQFDTGLSFGVDAVMALDGTLLLEEIVQAKEHLRAQYDELFPALSDHNPEVFPPELYTWEQFLWACELWYSNSMKVIFRDGKLRTCLIPIAGFLNHSILFGMKILKLDQLHVNGALTWFVVHGSPRTMKFFIMDCHTPCWIISVELEIQLCSQTRELLETDLDVLRDLSSTFEAMLENLGDEKIDNGEQTSWDVKLATEFKNLQRRIVSSISTSCNTGCELLESEFAKEDRLLNLNHHHDWLT
ncbi:hypothetical protein Sango_2039400 [Sesamum angolense]|uniref:Rubisco LSMT substrate-binding domain-containing protein n=1 Tax=Sesamum angolense TaxID=2727404 RepID=A0AAE2BP39_9LAMI|nr:hypothetical protein Sango_2039400 [Sesamum angolense]